MAKSIKDALSEAGITKASFRKASDDNRSLPNSKVASQAPKEELSSFSEHMRKAGVVQSNPVPPAPKDGAQFAQVVVKQAGSIEGKGEPASGDDPRGQRKTIAQRADLASTSSREKWDRQQLQRYIVELGRAYSDASPTAPKPVVKVAEQPIIKVIGPLIPNPLLFSGSTVEVALLRHAHNGIGEQMALPGRNMDEIDLTIGLDFGTSAVKVVIRDTARRAFAIPFFEEWVSSRYFLPSRVYEFADCYQIVGGGISHGDLKLSLLRPDHSESEFERAAAFLALVIRHSRGWLLSEHKDVYANSRLNWFLNLGVPAAKYQEQKKVTEFRALALAALSIAGCPDLVITTHQASEHCKMAKRAVQEGIPMANGIPIDMVDVVPEIAAQVFGFVQSRRFDEQAANNFMMVDVGAGTVDASIFHVRKETGNRVGFILYVNTVEQNGVMNLHRERLHWLRDVFSGKVAPDAEVIQSLDDIERRTDRLNPIPEHLADYFSGLSLQFSEPEQDPDQRFFVTRYWRQVFGNVLSAVRNRKLRDAQLSGLPVFLTGGGARMNYFGQIVSKINANQGATWAWLKIFPMEPPRELLAPSLKDVDYDRLSVAFGLSFIKLGKYVRSVDVPDLPPYELPDIYSDFISKDQV